MESIGRKNFCTKELIISDISTLIIFQYFRLTKKNQHFISLRSMDSIDNVITRMKCRLMQCSKSTVEKET